MVLGNYPTIMLWLLIIVMVIYFDDALRSTMARIQADNTILLSSVLFYVFLEYICLFVNGSIAALGKDIVN